MEESDGEGFLETAFHGVSGLTQSVTGWGSLVCMEVSDGFVSMSSPYLKNQIEGGWGEIDFDSVIGVSVHYRIIQPDSSFMTTRA